MIACPIGANLFAIGKRHFIWNVSPRRLKPPLQTWVVGKARIRQGYPLFFLRSFLAAGLGRQLCEYPGQGYAPAESGRIQWNVYIK